jgi:glycosyltransferase involved in cell wall biosynthesis
MSLTDRRLCMVSRIPGIAGPANFQKRLSRGLADRNILVSYDLSHRPYDAILVIGATRKLLKLQQAKREGLPVIQRLDGMNWIHRRFRTGVKHYLRAEINNFLLRFIRNRMADFVIYQSDFARSWWERVCGETAVESSVVHNGVPLDVFTPEGSGIRPMDHIVVLMVEGNLSGGYEVGLNMAIELVQRLQEQQSLSVELHIAGQVAPEVEARWELSDVDFVRWLGVVSPDEIPALDRSAHILYSGDPNPACPNAVIEALACGLPVVAFNSGALPEIVMGDAGRLAPYGGNPWLLEPPDMGALLMRALEVLSDLPRFQEGARARAVKLFGLERMVDGYVEAIERVGL